MLKYCLITLFAFQISGCVRYVASPKFVHESCLESVYLPQCVPTKQGDNRVNLSAKYGRCQNEVLRSRISIERARELCK